MFALATVLLVLPSFAATQSAALQVPPPSRAILRAPWGTRPGAFGVEHHGSRPGPGAIASSGGKIYVLDGPNARVQVFDLEGQRVEMRPTGTRTVDFLAVDGQGVVLVLDAFVRREIRVLRSGASIEIVPLPEHARALPSEVFAGEDAALVEWDHGEVTSHPVFGLVASPGRGRAFTPGLPGRPTPFGWVRAARSRAGIELLLGRLPTQRPQRVSLGLAAGVEAILALGADASGNVLVAAYRWNDPERRIETFLVSPQGTVLAHFRLPDGSLTDIYTRLCLAPDGRLLQLRTDQEGVEIREWSWRSGATRLPAQTPAKKGGER